MRVLVTGATGFIGTYLVRFLADRGDEVYGTYHYFDHLSNPESFYGVELLGCDIRDSEAIGFLVEVVKPQRIYHLAAQSFPTVSWKEPVLTAQTNIIGTINLFESVMRRKQDARILVACSSAEYGFVSEDEVPVGEDHFLKPLHPYGVSKVAQDQLAYQYFVNFDVQAVRVRIFNTTGPGKTDDVCSDFAMRIAKAEEDSSDPVIKVGNLSPKRDITDVRDVVKGLYLVLEGGEIGQVYNLCSGRAYQISDLLNIMLRLARRDISVEVSPELLRPTDEPVITGDNSKLRQKTGWEPQIPIEKTLEDLLNYWRRKESRIF